MDVTTEQVAPSFQAYLRKRYGWKAQIPSLGEGVVMIQFGSRIIAVNKDNINIVVWVEADFPSNNPPDWLLKLYDDYMLSRKVWSPPVQSWRIVYVGSFSDVQ